MGLRIGIVGANGAVGQEIVKGLGSTSLPVGEVMLFASSDFAEHHLACRGQVIAVTVPDETSFRGLDLVFVAAGASASRNLVPLARAAGAVVIDNSSAFRLRPDVPLVVPEVNGQLITGDVFLLANPNCSTTILSLPLKAIHDLSPLCRVVVATYQAASGAGRRGLDELEADTREALDGTAPPARVFPRPLPFNVIPHIGPFAEGGFTGEEWKIARETRKILAHDTLKIAATCVRVPVRRAHAEAVYVETREPLDRDRVLRALASFPGVCVQDEPAADVYPDPRQAEGRVEVLVGRCRSDPDVPVGFHFWVVGDQLLKGAAHNALQIAERRFADRS